MAVFQHLFFICRVYVACMRREDNNEWWAIKDTVAYLLKTKTTEPEKAIAR
jgi:hypothetical protein